jgi:hypothetical protein
MYGIGFTKHFILGIIIPFVRLKCGVLPDFPR